MGSGSAREVNVARIRPVSASSIFQVSAVSLRGLLDPVGVDLGGLGRRRDVAPAKRREREPTTPATSRGGRHVVVERLLGDHRVGRPARGSALAAGYLRGVVVLLRARVGRLERRGQRRRQDARVRAGRVDDALVLRRIAADRQERGERERRRSHGDRRAKLSITSTRGSSGDRVRRVLGVEEHGRALGVRLEEQVHVRRLVVERRDELTEPRDLRRHLTLEDARRASRTLALPPARCRARRSGNPRSRRLANEPSDISGKSRPVR